MQKRGDSIPSILLSAPHDVILLTWDHQHKAFAWLCNAKLNPLLAKAPPLYKANEFALLRFAPVSTRKPLDVLVFDMSSLELADGTDTFLTQLMLERGQLFETTPLIVSIYAPPGVAPQSRAPSTIHVLAHDYVGPVPLFLSALSRDETALRLMMRETRPDMQADLVLPADFDMDAALEGHVLKLLSESSEEDEASDSSPESE